MHQSSLGRPRWAQPLLLDVDDASWVSQGEAATIGMGLQCGRNAPHNVLLRILQGLLLVALQVVAYAEEVEDTGRRILATVSG